MRTLDISTALIRVAGPSGPFFTSKGNAMKQLKTYKPTAFMAKDSTYDKTLADHAGGLHPMPESFNQGSVGGKAFLLLPWQEQIIRDLFGIVKTGRISAIPTPPTSRFPKRNGRGEPPPPGALLLTCGDFEETR